MKLFDVVMKLVGPIHPIGKTEVDAERYVNLVNLIELTDGLLGRIEMVTHNADRVEASMKMAGKRAKEFMDAVKEAVED